MLLPDDVFIRPDPDTDGNALRKLGRFKVSLFDAHHQCEQIDVLDPAFSDLIRLFLVEVAVIFGVKSLDDPDLVRGLRIPLIVPRRDGQHHLAPLQFPDLLLQIGNRLPVPLQQGFGISAAAGCLNGIQGEIGSAQLADIEQIQKIRPAVFIITVFRVARRFQEAAFPIFPDRL